MLSAASPLLALFLFQSDVAAPPAGGPSARYREQAALLARSHAPVLVFHPDEQFYPSSRGVFTAGIDGDSGYKILWGVRDRGPTWSWYNSDEMDRRGTTAVRFCAA